MEKYGMSDETWETFYDCVSGLKGLCDIMTFLNDGGISIDGGYIGDCYDTAFRALKNCVYKCLGIKDLHVNDGEDYKEYRDENGIVCDYEINGKMWTTEGLYNAIINNLDEAEDVEVGIEKICAAIYGE